VLGLEQEASLSLIRGALKPAGSGGESRPLIKRTPYCAPSGSATDDWPTPFAIVLAGQGIETDQIAPIGTTSGFSVGLDRASRLRIRRMRILVVFPHSEP